MDPTWTQRICHGHGSEAAKVVGDDGTKSSWSHLASGEERNFEWHNSPLLLALNGVDLHGETSFSSEKLEKR